MRIGLCWHYPRGVLFGFVYGDGWITVHLGLGFVEIGRNPFGP